MPDPTLTLTLASVDDINTHLPTDKLNASDETWQPAINLISIDVDRLVRGYLSGVYTPTTLASWTTPTSTPDWIRGAAGRLIAAMFYAQRTSEDQPTITTEMTFAQRLYKAGMHMLEQVRCGEVILPTSEAPNAGTQFSEKFFLPNSQNTPPKFSMDTVFG